MYKILCIELNTPFNKITEFFSSIEEKSVDSIPLTFGHLKKRLDTERSNKTADGNIVDILALVPICVRHISFEKLYLVDLSADDFKYFFSALPKFISHLSLEESFGHKPSSEVIVNALKAIPSNITYLSLENNNLTRITSVQLGSVFNAIPKSVTHLSLEGNCLYNVYKPDNLVFAIPMLPEQITHLNFMNNHLNTIPIDDLEKSFAALPANLMTINLSLCGLEKLSVNQLSRVLTAISKNGVGRTVGGEATRSWSAFMNFSFF